jgi:excisionase family DNA binding protein
MKTSDLSIKELAAYIRVSTDTIRRAVRKGEIWGTLDSRAGRHCRPRAGRSAPGW